MNLMPPNKAMKADVEKRASNSRCTILASTFSGSAQSAVLFKAAYRRSVGRPERVHGP